MASPQPGELRIRHVLGHESRRLRELRLRSLAADPDAFASTHARERAFAAARWRRWAADSEDGARQRTFVVVDGADRWLGLALVRGDPPDSAAAVLNAMWVAPEARGRRAALALSDACADWALARGYRELTLQVVIGNESALRAYEAAGFVIRGETTWTGHRRTLREYVMARTLSR
jgi:RimJ/RimL family protein N-acetyltransferase